MAKKNHKMSLYEVINKSRRKSFYDKPLPKQEERKPAPVEPDNALSNNTVEPAETTDDWPKKSRAIEFISGRLELSVPYTMLIAFTLGLLLLMLVFFKLGRFYEHKSAAPRTQPKAVAKPPPAEGAGVIYNTQPETPAVTEQKPPAAAIEKQPIASEPPEGRGANRIVIKYYSVRRDLELAKKIFDEHGIDTEIIQRGNGFYLVTKKKTYNNPERSGTDGFLEKQKIIQAGSQYQPPAGYERFTFNDPYGEKVD